MQLTLDTQLLDAARALGPIIREYAEQSERERRLAMPVIDALAAADLFRMFTPRSLGGLEVDPVTCARVIEEVASFDSAAGWSLMVANSADWWCNRLPEEGPAEIYAGNPSAVLAAAFHPPMRAVAAPDGFRITGRSPLASNIHAAHWVFVTGLIMDGDQPSTTNGSPSVIGAILRAQDCEILDTWYAMGMRGTDSNDVAVHDAFVPTARAFPLAPEFTPGPAYQGPLYRLPAMAEVAAVIPPVSLAVARRAIDEFRRLAQQKTPFGSSKPLRERAVVQAKLGQAEATLQAARVLFYHRLDEAWDRAQRGETATLEQKADLLLAATHAVHSAVKAVELIYSLAGTTAIYTRSPLERHFRDTQVLRQHGFTAESRYEAAGQIYLGLAPDFALATF